MAFIQHGAAERVRIRLEGEFCPPEVTEVSSPHQRRERVTRRGAWRVGGLLGALAYSLVCWVLLFHGVRAVIAWTKPAAQVVTSTAQRPL